MTLNELHEAMRREEAIAAADYHELRRLQRERHPLHEIQGAYTIWMQSRERVAMLRARIRDHADTPRPEAVRPTPAETSPTYRQSMIDAGRRELLR
ncbi:MAG TPA: hypothetical protein VIV06_03145 [Candidatus Limnocylindrales bacterium]